MPESKNKSALRSKRPRSASRPRRLKDAIAIVGAGRLGTALGIALNNAGYRVEVAVTKHAASARRAAKLIGKGIAPLAMRQRLRPGDWERLSRCNLIIISTPDDVIPSVAGQLAGLFSSRTAFNSGRIVLHTSGALSADVLSPLRRAGIATGSLHPLVSVSDARTGRALFHGAFFAIEGDRLSRRAATSLVNDLGGKSFAIAPNAKALYHAAAVTASGHVTALYDIALEMLSRAGLSPRRAQQVLMPLLESTVRNLATKDPARALTGTFARGDLSTAKQHIKAIESTELHDALAAYVLLGKRSLRLAKTRAANGALDQIGKLLDASIASSSKR